MATVNGGEFVIIKSVGTAECNHYKEQQWSP